MDCSKIVTSFVVFSSHIVAWKHIYCCWKASGQLKDYDISAMGLQVITHNLQANVATAFKSSQSQKYTKGIGSFTA